MTPVVGIRGAIPTAIIGYEMDVISAYTFSVIGEFLPVFFIIGFLGIVSKWLSNNFKTFDKFFKFLFDKTKKDYHGRVGKYGLLALFFYTAIPVPFSGAWTASLIVFLFGLPYWKSILAIFLGVLASGLNILIIMELVSEIEDFYGRTVLLGLILLVSLIYYLYYRKNKNK